MRIVREARRPVAEIARELGIGAGTLGNWVRKERSEAQSLSTDERSELIRLRRRCAELEMERDVLKRSVVLCRCATTARGRHRARSRRPYKRRRGCCWPVSGSAQDLLHGELDVVAVGVGDEADVAHHRVAVHGAEHQDSVLGGHGRDLVHLGPGVERDPQMGD